MAKHKLVIDITQWVLIIIMSFFCVSLMSSGKQVSENFNNKNLISTSDKPSKSITVTYILVNNGDTTYVDRKLDSVIDNPEFKIKQK